METEEFGGILHYLEAPWSRGSTEWGVQPAQVLALHLLQMIGELTSHVSRLEFLLNLCFIHFNH